MDKTQAEAIAQAILEPGMTVEAAIRRKRSAETRQLAEKQKIAWLGLAGFAVGAVAAHLLGERFAVAGLCGGAAGTVIGWLIMGWHNRRRAARQFIQATLLRPVAPGPIDVSSRSYPVARLNASIATMDRTPNKPLIVGAALSAFAALLHAGCIVFGAPWYRFLGASERMAQLDVAGHWYPTVATLVITGMLAIWSLYALSGAGVIRKLPLTRAALCAITAVYLVRGVAFNPLMAYFPGNSNHFWFWSSAICLVFGGVHLLGLRQVWSRLKSRTG